MSKGRFLKDESINSHKIWRENGRPINGPLYDNKAKCKRKYKICIMENKKQELDQVSNELRDAFITKDNKSFWNMWNNKFKGSTQKTVTIEGASNEQEIANKFATFFAKNLNRQVNSKPLLENSLLNKFNEY